LIELKPLIARGFLFSVSTIISTEIPDSQPRVPLRKCNVLKDLVGFSGNLASLRAQSAVEEF